VFILFVVISISAPVVTRHDPREIIAINRLRPPDGEYWFGTDGFGRDIFSRIIYGGRLSLTISSLVVLFTTSIGVVLGAIAGYFEKIGSVLMRVLDGFMAFPSIILNIGIMAALGPSVRNVVIALTITYSSRMARIVRSAFIVQKEQQYVEAARVAGNSHFGVIMHVLPNCIGPIIVQATMVFAYAMLAEASLSFLGVGVPPEIPSWGNILAAGRNHIRRAPWITIYSGATIAVTVLSINMFGDGLRDLLDPKFRK